MSLTPSQHEAVSARGNVLVVAGAGTGKTRTLVERCLSCLLSESEPVSIDEILVVTFTEAAAAEMRLRIRDRLEQQAKCAGDAVRWREQLALFETAHIGTLHSFCLRLVRQHFYELELDPQLAVLSQEEAQLLAVETLDRLFQQHYSGKDPAALAVQRLIQDQARGWDKPIRALVLRLHHYAQSLPDPAAWLDEQLELFATAEPVKWRGWLHSALHAWPSEWLPVLDSLSATNEVARPCADALRQMQTDPSPLALAAVFEGISRAGTECKKASFKPLEKFFTEAEFLASLLPAPGKPEPLTQDWAWVRDHMSTLLNLSGQFTRGFAEAKRELGVVDFHDLEQHSLRLLWDHAANQPTPIAQQWQQKLRFLFVDEYQDINAAQDRIIQALSRESTAPNRFLVGDVKQSIYRFRLANPRIFREYARQWAQSPGRVVSLQDNYRGREGLIEFTNSLFELLMRHDLGGVEYDAVAALRFGAPDERQSLSLAQSAVPCAELHLLLSGAAEISEGEEKEQPELTAEVIELLAAEKEAHLVARRLCQLRAEQFPVWDPQTRQFRPVDWSDMAILLRSPAKKAESYAKVFSSLGLPLEVARAGFYQSTEISDLLSLLQLLDNPLQDIPALAVLHSPLVGLSANELAEIRLAAPKARFWTALSAWHRTHRVKGETDSPARNPLHEPSPRSAEFHSAVPQTSSLLDAQLTNIKAPHEKATPRSGAGLETHSLVDRFLKRFATWRRLARQVALSRCLETVLADTHYASWLLTLPRGQQRHARVQRLLLLAQEFDRFQRQGLFRFLKFVEAQQATETEPEVSAALGENSIRLMSIHQSKGLEFPVVVVADAGKPFNLMDLSAEMILDEEYGLCPHVHPPDIGKRYPSLANWLASKRQRRELLGEEMRLLYVAMTRARDLLILSGLVSQRAFAQSWLEPAAIESVARLRARSYCDWLALWFARNVGSTARDQSSGAHQLLRWFIHTDSDLVDAAPAAAVAPLTTNLIAFDSAAWRQVEQRLSMPYAFSPATRQPAKTSVTALRRLAVAEFEEETASVFRENDPGFRGFASGTNTPLVSPAPRLTSAERGRIYHQFLQLVSLDQTETVASLREEALRLQQEGRLDPQEAAVLDYKPLAAFWTSDLGRRIRSRRQFVQRELAFTARFSAAEVAALSGQPPESSLQDELVLVQGVVDLAVIAPAELWLVDFKTDQIEPDELPERVKGYEPQLQLYAKALSRIYHRPVTECWLYFFAISRATAVATNVVS